MCVRMYTDIVLFSNKKKRNAPLVDAEPVPTSSSALPEADPSASGASSLITLQFLRDRFFGYYLPTPDVPARSYSRRCWGGFVLTRTQLYTTRTHTLDLPRDCYCWEAWTTHTGWRRAKNAKLPPKKWRALARDLPVVVVFITNCTHTRRGGRCSVPGQILPPAEQEYPEYLRVTNRLSRELFLKTRFEGDTRTGNG